MASLKYNSSKSLEYIKLHRELTEKGFKYVDYFYTPSLDGKCFCGHGGLAHNFVLRNSEDSEVILGSTCIIRNQLYLSIFEGNPKKWEDLQKELKEYQEFFRMIRGSDEYKHKKVYLQELQKLKQDKENKWREDLESKRNKTKELLPELEAYAWITGFNFIKSIHSQALVSYKGLSDKQISVFEKIQKEYNVQHGVTVEEVLEKYANWKATPHFEQDFNLISPYIKASRYDLPTIERLSQTKAFTDWDYQKASDLIKRYRNQINKLSESIEYESLRDAIERFKENKILISTI